MTDDRRPTTDPVADAFRPPSSPITDKHLPGNTIQDWCAPRLSADPRAGLGDRSAQDTVAYLKTSRNALGAAFGPMADMVVNSTSKLTDNELTALAADRMLNPPNRGRAPVKAEAARRADARQREP